MNSKYNFHENVSSIRLDGFYNVLQNSIFTLCADCTTNWLIRTCRSNLNDISPDLMSVLILPVTVTVKEQLADILFMSVAS